MSKISYVDLVQKLISSQFINEGQLPDANGEFMLPPMYSSVNPYAATKTTYQLRLGHCKISRDQSLKLGLENHGSDEGGDTQVFETQIETERDLMLTQTEIDQSFDLDMEMRTPSQGDEISKQPPPSTSTRKSNVPIFRSPAVVPSFTSLLATINESIDPNRSTTQLESPPSLEVLKENDDNELTRSPTQNFFTQNMTQESLLEMEKWLLSSTQAENAPLLKEEPSKEDSKNYDVSSDDEPSQIKHYPLSSNPKFLHNEAPQEVVPEENGKIVDVPHSSEIIELSPDSELETQPQIIYSEFTETEGKSVPRSTQHGESHSVYIPDTLTSSWDTPPDVPHAPVQASPSTPSQEDYIGRHFYKTFPGVGTFCGCVAEYNRYGPIDFSVI